MVTADKSQLLQEAEPTSQWPLRLIPATGNEQCWELLPKQNGKIFTANKKPWWLEAKGTLKP